MLLMLTKDLFFVPRVRAAAAMHGVEVAVVLSADSEKTAALPAEQITACLIDLSSLAADQIGAAVQSLREQFPAARLIAYGPHVQTARLQAAETAGCHQILSRGQLDGQLDRRLVEWIQS